MTSRALAWRSLTRQPARAWLAIAGVAAVGALLFDMLLLGRGLALSFQDLLDATGYDVRVTASPAVPGSGPPIKKTNGLVAAMTALPEVQRATGVRWGRLDVEAAGGNENEVLFSGYGADTEGTWSMLAGQSLPADVGSGPLPLLINRRLASKLNLHPGAKVQVRGRCVEGALAPAPHTALVTGIARFPFENSRVSYAVARLGAFNRLCDAEDASLDLDLILVTAAPAHGDLAAVAAIRRLRPELSVYSNTQYVRRFQERDFSYFRQISAVLSLITLFFAFLLLTSLLTVSVNQRLAEVAALRALGFRRRRVAGDLLWETAMLVGAGLLLALVLGAGLAVWLDGLLREMPGIPDGLHFFVFWPGSLVQFAVLLGGAGLAASVYPIWLAARLPIAATLRREYVS